jgi:hypothetical protein
MADDTLRSRAARKAAEAALVRVVHHYGGRPEFVVLGGLVPELLCTGSELHHAGTTDVDVQVNLEIECGSVNTSRLERALRNADFEPRLPLHFRGESQKIGMISLSFSYTTTKEGLMRHGGPLRKSFLKTLMRFVLLLTIYNPTLKQRMHKVRALMPCRC